MAHTKGPWAHKPIESSVSNSIVYCLIGPSGALSLGHGIAYAGTYGKDRRLETIGIRQTDEECEANARLISASPELLAALENLLDLCEQTFAKPNECSEVLDARAAIAKAVQS
ncbi:MAG: hypothetical protein EOS04_24475 [Mesorhizobium sp.]|nr:MAG: hypothetical protein EOR98_26815 [Mesorhizobium sp.]RWN73146.1 MAG: hypothetical protein EOS01_26735 [Mesorhizobium sp.]RWN85199.1 MAG: hypothetical protein EOS04_24475 [Mesorhizobium sp.]